MQISRHLELDTSTPRSLLLSPILVLYSASLLRSKTLMFCILIGRWAYPWSVSRLLRRFLITTYLSLSISTFELLSLWLCFFFLIHAMFYWLHIFMTILNVHPFGAPHSGFKSAICTTSQVSDCLVRFICVLHALICLLLFCSLRYCLI